MIDTKALRSRVLDLAIQGKLTEQLESDGTAKELWQQIQAEKQRLIKEGKIKKEKPLPEISEDEIPFEIPENWKWVRLGSIGITVTGSTPSKKEPQYYGGNYPFYKPADLDGGMHITKASEYLSEEGKLASRQLDKGTILVCCIGSLGKCSIIDNNGTANQQINALSPIICMSEYLYYTICNDYFLAQLNMVSRATTLEIVNKSKFDNCIIPLPPLAEQKRIVARVEEIFRLLDIIDAAQEQYAADAESLKAKLITAGIQGKLTEQLASDGTAEELYQQIQAEKQRLIKEGKIKKEKPLPEIKPEEVPFEIPENWKWCRLGECIRLQSGQDFKPEEYNDTHTGTPYLTGASNIDVDGSLIINRWTEKPTCIAGTDDVLIVCKGSGYGKITICTIEYAHIARQFMAVKHSEYIDSNYMKLFLNSKLSEIKGNGQGLIPGIDRPSVLNLEIPLPPLAEQKRIVETLERVLGVMAII